MRDRTRRGPNIMTKKQFIKNITSMYNEPYDQALHILNDEHAYN